jgi:hypothetical protein
VCDVSQVLPFVFSLDGVRFKSHPSLKRLSFFATAATVLEQNKQIKTIHLTLCVWCLDSLTAEIFALTQPFSRDLHLRCRPENAPDAFYCTSTHHARFKTLFEFVVGCRLGEKSKYANAHEKAAFLSMPSVFVSRNFLP